MHVRTISLPLCFLSLVPSLALPACNTPRDATRPETPSAARDAEDVAARGERVATEEDASVEGLDRDEEALEGSMVAFSDSEARPNMPSARIEDFRWLDEEVSDRSASEASSEVDHSAASAPPELAEEEPAELAPQPAESGAELALDPPAPEPAAAALGPLPPAVASENLLGARVLDQDGAELGSVKDLLVDPTSGDVRRVVVHTAGGFDVELGWRREQWAEGGGRCALVVDGAEVRRREREPDIGRLFEGRELERLDGVVLAVEGDGPAAARGASLVLKLREPDNRFHRVLLAPPDELAALRAELAPEKQISVQGLFTRDERGALFVASSFTTASGTEWKRREAAARSGAGRARRSLSGPYVRAPGDEELELAGFIVDSTASKVSHVLLRVAGEQRLVDWSALAFDEEHGWSVSIESGELQHYPPVASPRVEGSGKNGK